MEEVPDLVACQAGFLPYLQPEQKTQPITFIVKTLEKLIGLGLKLGWGNAQDRDGWNIRGLPDACLHDKEVLPASNPSFISSFSPSAILVSRRGYWSTLPVPATLSHQFDNHNFKGPYLIEAASSADLCRKYLPPTSPLTLITPTLHRNNLSLHMDTVGSKHRSTWRIELDESGTNMRCRI